MCIKASRPGGELKRITGIFLLSVCKNKIFIWNYHYYALAEENVVKL